MIVAVAAGSSIPIPSYILANTGTTLTNINALTTIATVNIMLGYIKADFIFFLINFLDDGKYISQIKLYDSYYYYLMNEMMD